jgi:MFS superfamily sulfate permease-like transporter
MQLLRGNWPDLLVLLATFFLTILLNLATGIAVGIVLHFALGLAISHLKKDEL